MHWSRGEGNSKVLETPIFKVKIQVSKTKQNEYADFSWETCFKYVALKKNYDYFFFMQVENYELSFHAR